MASLARQYKDSTIKRLHALSGNECAAPDCHRKLIARDGETVVSKICHIEAASADGPRWNPQMSDDERRHFDNLILLCDECHTMIDNEDNECKYSVSLLKDWKKEHESTATYSFLTTRPSLLMTVINAIARIEFAASTQEKRLGEAFDIAQKVEYNAVKRNRPLIEEYRVFYSKINSLYQTLEVEGSFKKENLMRNIRNLYLQIKGKYIESNIGIDPQEVVKENADSIIEDVQDMLLLQTQKWTGGTTQEDVAFGVSIIVVDAFIRCKILEEPPCL